jgi:hypothetical protein
MANLKDKYMSDERLEKARALMREAEDKKNGVFSGDNASYPFWNIPENTTALIRCLPDKDESNPWFWSEKQTITLPFDGSVGGDSPTTNTVQVRVPCVDMFGDICPIIAETKPWWKDESKKELARTYYKKRTYIGQGFVVSSPFEEQAVPENPIRRFTFGKELVDKLKSGMADPEMEYFPTDYMNGSDFKIRKTKKGEFNNYGTSEWSRRSRPLTEAELAAIEQFKLFNLADFRGARPDADGIAAIKALFHASLRGDPYDFAEFGKTPFRPYGTGAADTSTSTPSLDDDDKVPAASVSKVEEVSEPAGKVRKPAELVAMLRERNASKSQ